MGWTGHLKPAAHSIAPGSGLRLDLINASVGYQEQRREL